MYSRSNEVKEILSIHVDPALLHGYMGGIINQAHTLFRGVTLVDLTIINYADFRISHELLDGYSETNIPEELTRDYITSHNWNYKSREVCIDEGIYRYFSVSLAGVLWENKWIILKWMTYFGDMELKEIQEYLNENFLNENFSDSDLFKPCNKQPINEGQEFYEFKEFGETPYLVALIKSQELDGL